MRQRGIECESHRTRRSSEREPADSLRDKSNVIGGWLPSLTFFVVPKGREGFVSSPQEFTQRLRVSLHYRFHEIRFRAGFAHVRLMNAPRHDGLADMAVFLAAD